MPGEFRSIEFVLLNLYRLVNQLIDFKEILVKGEEG
jgi:hypothetical protein